VDSGSFGLSEKESKFEASRTQSWRLFSLKVKAIRGTMNYIDMWEERKYARIDSAGE
jgi:hypothetical protein